eukprot:4754993-Pleurochrysis_carterae.AAC.1
MTKCVQVLIKILVCDISVLYVARACIGPPDQNKAICPHYHAHITQDGLCCAPRIRAHAEQGATEPA